MVIKHDPFGSPSAAYAPGTQLVYWTTTNGHIYEAWYTGRWNGPADLTAAWGNAAPAISPPAAGYDPTGSGTQLVYWQAANNHLYEAWFTGVWNGPQDQSASAGWPTTANLAGAPGLSIGGGQQMVFWRGPSLDVVEVFWDSHGWNGPYHMPWSG